MADCLENLISRQIGLQTEMNKVRNEAEATNNIFKTMIATQQRYLQEDNISILENKV